MPISYTEYNTLEIFKEELKSNTFLPYLDRCNNTALLIKEAKKEAEEEKAQ